MTYPSPLAYGQPVSGWKHPGFRFQPIVHLADGRPMGHELLAGRNACPNFDPQQWGAWYETVPALLRTCAPDGPIFVNVTSEQLAKLPAAAQALRAARAHLGDNLVIEWTEQDLLESGFSPMFDLCSEGFRLAVDDVGAGMDGIGRVLMIRPEYAKISHNVFHQMRGHDVSVLRYLRELLEALGCQVILEGVETTRDRDIALSAGLTFAQGWLYPALSFPGLPAGALKHVA